MGDNELFVSHFRFSFPFESFQQSSGYRRSRCNPNPCQKKQNYFALAAASTARATAEKSSSPSPAASAFS